jgi:hypothetical protein
MKHLLKRTTTRAEVRERQGPAIFHVYNDETTVPKELENVLSTVFGPRRDKPLP